MSPVIIIAAGIWLLIGSIIGFIIVGLYQLNSHKIKRFFNLLTQKFYSKIVSHCIRNREVYVLKPLSFDLAFTAAFSHFHTNKTEKLKTFIVKGFGYKEPFTPDVVDEIEGIAHSMVVFLASYQALQGSIIKSPNSTRDDLIFGKFLFIENLLKLFLSKEKLDDDSCGGAGNETGQGKDSCNKGKYSCNNSIVHNGCCVK